PDGPLTVSSASCSHRSPAACEFGATVRLTAGDRLSARVLQSIAEPGRVWDRFAEAGSLWALPQRDDGCRELRCATVVVLRRPRRTGRCDAVPGERDARQGSSPGTVGCGR